MPRALSMRTHGTSGTRRLSTTTGFCLASIRIALPDIRELSSSDALDGAELPLGPVALELGVLLGVREQDRVARLARRLVGAADDLAVEGVRDVGDDDREAAGALPDQPVERLGAVADVARRGEDALSGT